MQRRGWRYQTVVPTALTRPQLDVQFLEGYVSVPSSADSYPFLFVPDGPVLFGDVGRVQSWLNQSTSADL